MRALPVLGAFAVLGLLIGLLVAVLMGTAPGGRALAVGWTIQVLVLVGAAFLLAGRMTRRG